ncbi:MAG: SdpI family protein [Firmicutes bacterium]|nr:SdpI family protein [Bacillota bacterium]MBR5981736.1 SdpI family protein [Bacillota bacterium]
MKNKKLEIILAAVIALLPMIAGVILYDRLPDQIATHFGLNGEADGWSSRAAAVFMLPAVMAGVTLLCGFSLSTDPKKQNMNPALRSIGIWSAPAVSILVSAFILSNALGYTSRIELIVPVAVGLLFILIGNYLPKTKQSYTMGIRLPWTLASEENWNRTHRLAGFLWVAGGGLMIVLSLLHLWAGWLIIVVVTLLALIPAIYSYLLYRKGI